METKVCIKCGEEKKIYAKGMCKKCYRLKWYKDNSERVKESIYKWRKKNPERVKELNRKWKINNSEKVRELNRKWQKNNPEKVMEYIYKWQKNNPEKVMENVNKWRKKNPEKVRISTSACRNRNIDNMANTYIKTQINNQFGIKAATADQHPELIDAYREQIRIKRLLREKKKQTNKTA